MHLARLTRSVNWLDAGTRRLPRWVIAHMSDLDVARRLGPASDSEDQFLTDLVLTDPLLHVAEGIDGLAIHAKQAITAADVRLCELTTLPGRR